MENIEVKLPDKNSFSFIRLLCCLIVIFDHTWSISRVNPAWITGLSGGMAIYIFFILSGFWVTISFLRSSSIKEYFSKRFKKIFPAYWIVVILSAVFFVFFSELTMKEYFSNTTFFKYLEANIITLGFICNNLPGINLPYGINGALWKIKIEVGFYIVLPLIFCGIDKILKNTIHSIGGGGIAQ